MPLSSVPSSFDNLLVVQAPYVFCIWGRRSASSSASRAWRRLLQAGSSSRLRAEGPGDEHALLAMGGPRELRVALNERTQPPR